MRIFVTGASGYIGSAVVQELLGANHDVVALARSDDSARGLTAAGAEVVRGELTDLDTLRQAAKDADAVIHLAFIHDFSDYANSAVIDKQAIEAIGETLAGTYKSFVVTSGTAGIVPGRIASESDPASPQSPRFSESAALAFVDKGVRVSIVRLSPTVHSDRDAHGFIPTIINVARDKGVSGYPGDGSNRWSAVHVMDAARLFRLAVEVAPAGAILHGVGDEAVTSRKIAEIIGKHLDIPVESIPADKVAEHFGWIGNFFALDIPASSATTQQEVGWNPQEVGLIEDLEAGHYFN